MALDRPNEPPRRGVAEQDVVVLRDTDEAWPQHLRGLGGMPRALYVAGSVSALARPAVAIVGTRAMSRRGRGIARLVALAAARRGFVVVSGLAVGIDTRAHEGALDVEAPTVAVLAHGLHTIYPAANARLAGRILATDGALVSEHPWGVPLSKQQLVVRNRITSALARFVVVVETSPTGGAMHAARFAHRQGRRVLVVLPDERDDLDASGAAALVQEIGATPVRSPREVLDAIGVPGNAGA